MLPIAHGELRWSLAEKLGKSSSAKYCSASVVSLCLGTISNGTDLASLSDGTLYEQKETNLEELRARDAQRNMPRVLCRTHHC